MKEDLKGKVALITGGSSGIGKSVAERLAKEGANLVLLSRTKSKLDEVKRSIQENYDGEVFTISTDITDDKQVDKAVDKTIEKFGSIDIVVSNAGTTRYGEIEDFSTEDFETVMETNCYGMFFITRAVLPHLRKSKGNLIFIGSFDSHHPRSVNPIYASSKWWTRGFAHSIEALVGKDGVAVTLVNPSEVRTEIKSDDGVQYKEKFEEGEVSEPEEIADVVAIAAKQSDVTTLSEVNVYRRNKIGDFF